MPSIGPADALPGNLSAQQMFILAVLAIEHDDDATVDPDVASEEIRSDWYRQEELQPAGCSYRTLTLAVAREFDDGEGSHLGKRDVHSGADTRSGTPKVTDQHRTSFATSVRRLEERNYLVRWCGRHSDPLRRAETQRRHHNIQHVVPTERRLRAGYEAL